MNKKNRSTKSEKWRHTCNSVEIAWTNEQKVAVTSYGRNKNHDDEIKKHSRKNSGSDSKPQNLTNKTLLAAEAITIWIQPLTHYLPWSDLRIGET